MSEPTLIGAYKLRAQLTDILSRAKSGEVFVVTRGHAKDPVASIGPPEDRCLSEDEAELVDLAKRASVHELWLDDLVKIIERRCS